MQEISWRAAEFEYQEKSVGWFFIIILVALILIIVSIWQKNFFFAVFIVIATAMLFEWGRRKPKILVFKITEKGIGIEKRFFTFEELESFAHRARVHHLDELVIKKRTTINPFIHIPIDAKLAENAVVYLREKLPEEEHQESLLDAVVEWLGF